MFWGNCCRYLAFFPVVGNGRDDSVFCGADVTDNCKGVVRGDCGSTSGALSLLSGGNLSCVRLKRFTNIGKFICSHACLLCIVSRCCHGSVLSDMLRGWRCHKLCQIS